MIGYWAAFAATGNPNGGGRVTWPGHAPLAASVQRLAQDAQGAVAPSTAFGTEHRCAFWRGFGV